MKEYGIQEYGLYETEQWWGMGRAAGVNVPYMTSLEKAREVYGKVIAAAQQMGDDASNYRIVAREVTPWEAVEA